MSDIVEVVAIEIPAPRGHFAHAIRAGRTLYVSGLLALDGRGAVVHEEDVAGQTEHILASLEKVLDAAGLSRRHVVKLTIYLTDISERSAVGAVRGEFFGDRHPASTLVEVSALGAPGARVEIEAIAVSSG